MDSTLVNVGALGTHPGTRDELVAHLNTRSDLLHELESPRRDPWQEPA